MNLANKISQLKEEVKRTHLSLTLSGNPFCLDEELSVQQLKRVIQQYSVFSNEAIHCLLDAMIRSYEWPIFYKEIEENIEEEKGKFTNGVPHLEMMRKGYLEELKIDTTEVFLGLSTHKFISSLRRIFRSNDLPFLCGAVVSFESVAIEEFHILEKIIKNYCSKREISYEDSTVTRSYVEGHKDFEIEHESHLIESASAYINEENYEKFREGVLTTTECISTWWKELYEEINFSELKHSFSII